MSDPAKATENPWDIYPRPQLRRRSFYSLNGTWTLNTAEQDSCEIQVPFCVESRLSGVMKHPKTGASLIYRKVFRLPEDFWRGRVLLHFGAVDQIARVVVNDRFYGSHEGGYTAFTVDITPSVRRNGENELLVFVEDYLELHTLPSGKQKEKRGGMWYTPVTGIWQSVWLESVPADYIPNLRIRTAKDHVSVDIIPEAGISASSGLQTPGIHPEGSAENSAKKPSLPPVLPISGHLKYHDGLQEVTVPVKRGHAEFTVKEPHFWSPEDPFLYPFTLSAGADTVESYFALRDIGIGTVNGRPRLLLNGKPYYFHGVLDQGYFDGGIYTPETPAAYEKDLELLKACGFNMLRKHIKIEPEVFYWYCDRMGFAVFQDMVNCGRYSYFRDTILPTIGIGKNRSDRRLNRSEKARSAFQTAMAASVSQLMNHPSIVYWTIFNEGWGQFEGSEMYDLLKSLDDSRVIDTASGWYHGKGLKTDVESRHVYFKAAKPVRSDKPYVLSEYGGYTLAVEGHVFDPGKSYGYKGHQTKDELMEDLSQLMERDVIAAVSEGLSADIYTQLSDVEDEVNGLVTYDREVVKVDPAQMQALAERIFDAFRKGTENS